MTDAIRQLERPSVVIREGVYCGELWQRGLTKEHLRQSEIRKDVETYHLTCVNIINKLLLTICNL